MKHTFSFPQTVEELFVRARSIMGSMYGIQSLRDEIIDDGEKSEREDTSTDNEKRFDQYESSRRGTFKFTEDDDDDTDTSDGDEHH